MSLELGSFFLNGRIEMAPSIALDDFDAVLFDLDGVLTTTRSLHAAAWKHTFGEFLARWDARRGTRTARFDDRDDYTAYVDGKPRQQGVREFLTSRGIVLPEGEPDSLPEEDSVWGLGNRKQLLVEEELERAGVEVFPGSVAWVRELREAGLQTAVVSSSRNCAAVLAYAGITKLFDARVDGETALQLHLSGKPAPDTFLEAARRLSVSPDRAIVVEDALAGVEAGRAGAFGLVVGVDRGGNAEGLIAHGADLVVGDLGELLAAPTERLHRAGPRTHRLLSAAKRIIASTGDYPTDSWRLIERRTTPDTSSRPRHSSLCRTASSESAPRSRRANPPIGRRLCSTGSTRPGRSPIRRPRMVSQPRVRPSCRFPTGPPSSCSSTTTWSLTRRQRSESSNGRWTCDMAHSTVPSCTNWPMAVGSGLTPGGSSRWPSGIWPASATR
jgi:beta-phosphoglucomutase family hydrolase